MEHRKTNLWLLICSYILMVLGHDLGHKECLVGVRCFVLPFSELELFSTTFPFRIELSWVLNKVKWGRSSEILNKMSYYRIHMQIEVGHFFYFLGKKKRPLVGAFAKSFVIWFFLLGELGGFDLNSSTPLIVKKKKAI